MAASESIKYSPWRLSQMKLFYWKLVHGYLSQWIFNRVKTAWSFLSPDQCWFKNERTIGTPLLTERLQWPLLNLSGNIAKLLKLTFLVATFLRHNREVFINQNSWLSVTEKWSIKYEGIFRTLTLLESLMTKNYYFLSQSVLP